MADIIDARGPKHSKFKPLWPAGPRNRTDLHVVFDPEDDHLGDYVAVMRTEDEDNKMDAKLNKETEVKGIQIPVIKLNNLMLKDRAIYYFKMKTENFLPEVDLIVYDEDNEIRSSDTPGLNNSLTIIMTHPSDGVYKKVALNFYITEYRNDGSYIHIRSSLKIPYLDKLLTRQIKSVDDKQLVSTYEFFEKIAKDAKLGFATTEEVKNVRDNIYRRLESEKIGEAMSKHIEWAGVDENTYMDGWLDWYGYLDLVNISWLFREEVKIDEMSLIAHYGYETTGSEKSSQAYEHEITRVINNSVQQPGPNNMIVRSYEEITNPGSVYYTGTLETHYSVSMQANGGTGVYDMYQVQSVENSVDGRGDVENYTFESVIYDGFLMNQTRDLLKQRNLRNAWLRKIKSRVLHVTLDMPNYGIQRGMIIGVWLTTTDTKQKQMLLKNSQNVSHTAPTDHLMTSIEALQDAKDVEEIQTFYGMSQQEILTQDVEFPVYNLCGTYYVQSMTVTYEKEKNEMKHELWLIKTTHHNNIINKKTMFHFKAK